MVHGESQAGAQSGLTGELTGLTGELHQNGEGAPMILSEVLGGWGHDEEGSTTGKNKWRW
jgi:hypothetical protein